MNPRHILPLLALVALSTLCATGCQTTVPGPQGRAANKPPARMEADSASPRRPRAPVQRENHYDASGRYIGYSERRGNRRMNYDANGRWVGHSEQKGGAK